MVQRLLSEYFPFYIQIFVSTKHKEIAEALRVTRVGTVAKALGDRALAASTAHSCPLILHCQPPCKQVNSKRSLRLPEGLSGVTDTVGSLWKTNMHSTDSCLA